MRKIIYISLLAAILAACGTNKSEVSKIEVEIPVALNDNEDAKELIEDMTDAVNSCRNNMAIGAKFALEQEKSGSDSLTVRQGMKAGMFAAKMMLSAQKIEKLREEAEQLKPELSDAEWLALKTKMDDLETSVGDLNPEDLGLTEEDIAKLNAEEELQVVEEENIVEKDPIAEQQDLENGIALRELEESLMQSANANNETQQSESNSEGGSSWFGILFTILVIVLIIIGVRRSVRVYKRRFKNASNSFSQIKNQFNNK